MKPRALRKVAFPFLAYRIDKANGEGEKRITNLHVCLYYGLPRSNNLYGFAKTNDMYGFAKTNDCMVLPKQIICTAIHTNIGKEKNTGGIPSISCSFGEF
jgi:hypothetical protein